MRKEECRGGVFPPRLERFAAGIRRRVLEHTLKHNGGYLSQACSSAEIFAALYGAILRLKKVRRPIVPGEFRGVPGPDNPVDCNGYIYNGERGRNFDRFILSPSQYSLVLYAVLIEAGRMAEKGLDDFNRDGGIVEMIGAEHSPGMEIMTGSLGQGISQAAGIAMGRKLKGDSGRVVIFMSDGEFQIGQTWEAIQTLAFYRLNRVRVFVDMNGQQCDGPVSRVMNIEPLDKRLEAFGCRVFRFNGHDVNKLVFFGSLTDDKVRPTVILADTVPYQGIDLLKKKAPKYHYLRFSDEKEKEVFQQFLKKMVGVGNGHARSVLSCPPQRTKG